MRTSAGSVELGNSKAPMSAAGPYGRAKPRWSTAGAAAVYGVYLPAVLAFNIPVLGAFTVTVLAFGTTDSYLLAIMVSVYFTMLIIGGALTLALADKGARSAEILLALPFAIFVAGVAHVAADRRIDDIGIYIRDILRPSVADELEVALTAVNVEFAPAGKEYANMLLGTQITGGSTSFLMASAR